MKWFPAPTKLSHICHTTVRGRQPQNPIPMSLSLLHIYDISSYVPHPINTWNIFLRPISSEQMVVNRCFQSEHAPRHRKYFLSLLKSFFYIFQNFLEQMLPIWARAAPSQIASAIVYNLALPCHHAIVLWQLSQISLPFISAWGGSVTHVGWDPPPSLQSYQTDLLLSLLPLNWSSHHHSSGYHCSTYCPMI